MLSARRAIFHLCQQLHGPRQKSGDNLDCGIVGMFVSTGCSCVSSLILRVVIAVRRVGVLIRFGGPQQPFSRL
jgi:hypothetical protein